MGEFNSPVKKEWRDLARLVRKWSTQDFYEQMVRQWIYRAFIVYENGIFTLSHPKQLEPIQAFFEFSHDFSKHEGVFIGREEGLDVLFFAFVQDTRRGLAQGGLRFKTYENMAELLTDGLRLAQGMTRKNALAGLWWGGGKGIMTLPPGIKNSSEIKRPEDRRPYFEAYGRFIASLGGIYYTAEDMGTSPQDLKIVLSENRFTTCIPTEIGGSGNPSPFTARGVFRAMQAAWRFLKGTENLKGVRVAIQGVGNVGTTLARDLYDAGAELWLSDIAEKRDHLLALKNERPGINIVEDEKTVYDLPVDIFSPCAGGEVIKEETILRLKKQKVQLVCGAANNILKEPEDANRLREAGIAYVPDYICNRMGITNCADEWMGYLSDDVRIAAERIYPDTLRVFQHARNRVITTAAAANELSDIAASELHPIIGHRGRRIIDHLIDSDWAMARTEYEITDASLKELRINAPDEEPVPEAVLKLLETLKGQKITGAEKFLPLIEATIGNDFTGKYKSRLLKAAQPKKTSLVKPAFDPALDEERIRRGWEQTFKFRGNSLSLAAAPISTAGPPSIDSFLLPVLLDVKARAIEQRPRRMLGSDHGGLSLQLAVERAIPYEREEVGRPEFLEICQDYHGRNDAAIREQLHQLGVGFDPQAWLDPMNRRGQEAVQQLFFVINDAGLMTREDYFSYLCPHCQTVLVSTEVVRNPPTTERHIIYFPVKNGNRIETSTFLPELVLGAVAVAVDSDGPFASFAGETCQYPFGEKELPVIKSDNLGTPAAFLVPEHNRKDAEIVQKQSIPCERIRVYDELGRICVDGYKEKDPDEVRQMVIEKLGENTARCIGEKWKVERCSRCGSLVVEGISKQLFINFETVIESLRKAIESSEILFTRKKWKKRTLGSLELVKSWCISRQNWWGNPLPTDPNREVLSPWFSLAAWALSGNGWPDAPEPSSIDEVFVNPQLLERWVIPTQLISLLISGKPIFRRIHVYGSMQVIELHHDEREDIPSNQPDEERFEISKTHQHMNSDKGNVVQPKTLIRRFGADALRLGYLLCCDSGIQENLTLSEIRLRHARKTIKTFTSKVTGLFNIRTRSNEITEARLLDSWILTCCAKAFETARQRYTENRLHDAASLFVDTIRDFVHYADITAQRPRESIGPVRATTAKAIETLAQAFGPICPYLFEKLLEWTQANTPEIERAPQEEPWIFELIQLLSKRPGYVEIASPDPLFVDRISDSRKELELLTNAKINPTTSPSVGAVEDLQSCLVIRPGELRLPENQTDIIAWYCSLHK